MFVQFEHTEIAAESPPLLSRVNNKLMHDGINRYEGELGKLYITMGGNYSFEQSEEKSENAQDEYRLTCTNGADLCLIITIEKGETQISQYHLSNNKWILSRKKGQL